jgi:hypothetical protein
MEVAVCSVVECAACAGIGMGVVLSVAVAIT